MTTQPPLFVDPGDAPVRAAISTELDATLFVEAGAGTGKTRELVNRIVAVVTAPNAVSMREIAAITFTEKAAAELRDRVRRELQLRADAEPGPVADACRAAIDELDEAAICTLHAFAQRILGAFPVEVGLPPRIVVRDEISSRVAFESRWRDFVTELLDDPELEPSMLVMLAADVRPDRLRAVAEVLDDNWDLLDRIADPPPLPALDLDVWFTELDAVCAASGGCRADDDRLLGRLAEIRDYGDRIRDAFDDAERIRLLASDKPSFKVGNAGRKGNWPDIDAVRERVVRLGEQRAAITGVVLDAAVRRVVAAVAGCTARAVEDRRIAGEVEFHDLLVLARSLLRDERHGARARAYLRTRYQRVFIDEFQDTDPIQAELAALLGSDAADDAGRAWSDMRPEPGRLFFVGDPKQSIYRFRRADIATFLTAAARFADGGTRQLTCNFRTAPGVLAWVNHVFTELIRPVPDSQPDYVPLDAARPVPAEYDRGVVLLGVDPHDEEGGVNADELRRREAAEVARAVHAAIAERWPVYDRATEEWRPARLGDICILLPARTSLPFLEDALDAAAIPYRAETSSLVYGTREIRDLLAALRAVDDPSDALSLLAALRSSLFGCGDDDLFEYHVEHGGSWDIRRQPPATLAPDHPVVEAVRFLGALHDERAWSTPSELLDRIVRERRVVEVGAARGRFRDVARRVRFLVDQARAFADAAGGTLRDYIAWAQMQGTEGARVVEAVVPETDDDAVRILTIHGAKGLEFPIVICSGTTTAAQGPAGGVQVLFPPAGGCEVKLAKGVQTDHFELHQPLDEQMGFHEKLRLLYVACTRARDHLVVSVHRKVRNLDADDRKMWTHAELLWSAAETAPFIALPAAGETDAPPATIARSATVPDVVLMPDEWHAANASARAAGARRGYVSATTLAHRVGADAGATTPADDPGLAKGARDLDLPPWNKGRYGTAIGRAVHATLQTVDLVTGAGIDETAAAQAAAEGVLGYEDTIAALARAAIGSNAVRSAAVRPHWREMYVAVPLDGVTLEGYLDLLYRDDDGLVVVDYKTDAIVDPVSDPRTDAYRLQVAAYAAAVTDAAAEPVHRAVLCFLAPEGATEVVVEGSALATAVDAVRAAIRAERDDPSPLPAPILADA